MPQPLVSIVTPVLNGMPYLPELIRSIRDQDYPRIEHVVVDGGSTDGTLEVLQSTTGLVWVSRPDAGMYEAINRGFALASGEVLAYQNADDRYVVPGAVTRATRRLAECPEADGVYGRFRYIDSRGHAIAGSESRPPPFDLDRLRRYNCVPPHALFVRSRAVKESGHWLDPSLQFAGDWDWVLGMALAGHRLVHVPDLLSEFRLHAGSKSATVPWGRKAAEWRRICRRHGVAFATLLWYETFYAPLRRRLRLPA